jgi:hypothetical protein
MKNWKYIIRIIGILTVGLLLVKLTYQFKYSSFMFDPIFFGGLTIIGLALLIWSLLTDLKHFRTEKKIISLIPIGLAVIFSTTIWVWNLQINSNFDKPTLVRIFYDGDFNGTGIDFKTDGTFIFDNSAIGLGDYIYGTYEINGNRIFLDKNHLDNVIVSNQLEIRPKTVEYSDRTETNKYVYQVDGNGNVLKNSTEFRLVVENRNK